MLQQEFKESQPISHKEACEACQAEGKDNHEDNRVVYIDESWHCFACGDHKFAESQEPVKKPEPIDTRLVPSVIMAIPSRKLTLETCQKYKVGMFQRSDILGGDEVVVYPICENGKTIRQKIRSVVAKDKQTQVGQDSLALFGMHWMEPNANFPIIITEGEYDAMAIYQATGWPAVSGTRGSGGLAKEIEANLIWLSKWKHVTLCFDDDEAGQKALEKCWILFEAGKVRSCQFPLKDANDMVMAGREEEVKRCLYNAKILKPNTLVTPKEIRDRIKLRPKHGSSWPWDSFTKATYGMRWGELYVVAAAPGIGKTELVKDITEMMLARGEHIGFYSLEQTPEDTMRRLIGSRHNKRLYLPGCDSWDDEEIDNEIESMDNSITLYDVTSGDISLDSLLINMRYTNKCNGARFFIVDNLWALHAHNTDPKYLNDIAFIKQVIGQLSRMCKQLGITIIALNHLNTDKVNINAYASKKKLDDQGNDDEDANAANELSTKIANGKMSWETGRWPSMGNIYGSGASTNLADYVIVLARNKMSEDETIRCTTNVKFLKCRFESSMEGKSFSLIYNRETGRLEENNGLSEIL